MELSKQAMIVTQPQTRTFVAQINQSQTKPELKAEWDAIKALGYTQDMKLNLRIIPLVKVKNIALVLVHPYKWETKVKMNKIIVIT